MRLILLALILLFAGCARHGAPEPGVLHDPAIVPWWRSFGSEALTDAIETSLSRHPSLASYRHRLEQLKAIRAQNLARLRPSLTASAGYSATYDEESRYDDYSLSLAFDYDPDIFSKNRDLLSAAGYDLEAVRLEWLAAKNEFAAQIAKDWAGYCYQRRITEALAERVALLERYVALYESYYLSGERGFDQLSNTRRELIRARSDLERSRLTERLYKASFEYETDTAPRCASLKEKVPLPDISIADLAKKPDLLVIRYKLFAAQKRAASAEKYRLPDLRLSAFLRFGAERLADLIDSWLLGWGVSLAQSIYEGGARKARAREQRERAREIVQQYKDALLRSLLSLKNARIGVEEAELAIAQNSADLAALRSRHEALELKFASQEIGGLDLLRSRIDLLVAREQILRSKRDLLQNEIDYLKTTALCKDSQ